MTFAALAVLAALLLLPAPFFGTQAVRLLREQWPDATQLADELYAMLDDNIPQTQNAPVTINNTNPHDTSLTINNTVGGNTLKITGGDTTVNGDTITIGGKVVKISGDTVTINNINILDIGGGGGGTTNVFLGKVLGGTGDTYQVAVYGNGSAQAATDTVTATVPQIDPTETVPAGTWLAAVHKFVTGADTDTPQTTYEFQPPVWMNG